MADLICKAGKCIHNKSDCCCKGDIMVGGKQVARVDDTCCTSFSAKKNESYTSALENPTHTINVDCEVENCMHNEKCSCSATHVDITGDQACECTQTCCGTFQEA